MVKGEKTLTVVCGAEPNNLFTCARSVALPFTPRARPRRGILVEPLQDILAREAVAALGRGVQQRDGARRVPLAPAAVEQAVGEHEEGRGVVLLRVRVRVGVRVRVRVRARARVRVRVMVRVRVRVRVRSASPHHK